MIMMALTEEIERRLQHAPGIGAMSFFFCQNTMPELSNATAIVRGLTYLLAIQQPALSHRLRTKFEEAGEQLFKGFNVFYTLWHTLLYMVQDVAISKVLLIDALDECDANSIQDFLKCVSEEQSSAARKIKWIVSSRNEQHISQQLQNDRAIHDTSLELNHGHVADAVQAFIADRVGHLARKKSYTPELVGKVRQYLQSHADNTFLWVALVCKELGKVATRKTQKTMESFPAGLQPLYQRMLEQLQAGDDPEDTSFRERILRAVTLALRPLHVDEVAHLAGLPADVTDDTQEVAGLISSCGSFLTIRDDVVSFVHLSAKDYFTTGRGTVLFPDGHAAAHEQLGHQLLDQMSRHLRKNICGRGQPGLLVSDVDEHTLARMLPLHMRYACLYWADHMQEGKVQIEDHGKIHHFLRNGVLFWLEALGWMQQVSGSVRTATLLQRMMQVRGTRDFPIHHDVLTPTCTGTKVRSGG